MDRYKTLCNETVSWTFFYEKLGFLSKALRHEDKKIIKENMCELFYSLFNIASLYDINMDVAWNTWDSKASCKHYQSSI